jgi:triosephosphate isomerase (TIM)
MRTKLVCGNWKMNLTGTEARARVQSFITMVEAKSDVDVVLCPPYLAVHPVRELVRNTHIKVGAQDVFWKDSGAFTGSVSAPMLLDAGVDFCIVGHSETRGRFGKLEIDEAQVSYFSETDATVNLKIKHLLFHSIVPVLCVGETQAERMLGETEAVVLTQLKADLAGIDSAELHSFVVAYEPVWAIGTGQTCDSAEAGRVCRFIRSTIASMYDDEVAGNVRILYGGSVKAANAAELFSQEGIDGGLVGGASLDAQEFSRIVMSA